MISVQTIAKAVPLLLLPVACSWVLLPSTRTQTSYHVQSYPHFSAKTDVDNQGSVSGKSALEDVIDKALDQDDNRNVPSLTEWAIGQGVQIADGIELVDNGLGDWGVGLNQSHSGGTPVMTIPSSLILSSNALEVEEYRDAIEAHMKDADGMEFFVPECLLILRVLEEKSRGASSSWKPWLETLPKSFNTGLFLDQLERAQAERLAPEFLKQQDLQWNACSTSIRKLLDEGQLSDGLTDYLTQSENDNNASNDDALQTTESLIRWAFSVVFTRSWRTAAGGEATLVPLGDMFNHDSQNPNVAPQPYSDDGSIQLSLKEDTEAGTGLFITYGLSNFPGRFLILFGFWDRSSLFMDANLTIPEELKIDRSQLVVSTRNGAITEDVWNLAVYNVLLQRDEAGAAKMAKAINEQDEATMEALCLKWSLEAALYLRLHVLKLLSQTYPDMDLVPENMSGSPRRYGMIARYNNAIRDSWTRVADYLEEEIDDALDRREAAEED